MRMVFLSFLFAVVAGCAVEDPPSEAARLTPVAAPSVESATCSRFCSFGSLCLLPDGSCGPVCNACFCGLQGGEDVSTCPGGTEF